MRVLVATLGFDEKFAIRALMRHSDEIRKVVIVIAEPVEERAMKALNEVEKFIKLYLEGKSVEVIKVNPSSVYDAIVKLKNIFSAYEEYIVNISGGMRALIVELLIAFTLSRARGIIEIELENFRGLISLPPEIFMLPPLSSEEYKILREIVSRGRVSPRELIKALDIPRSTFYKYMRNLVSKKLVIARREDRRTVYEATKIARIMV